MHAYFVYGALLYFLLYFRDYAFPTNKNNEFTCFIIFFLKLCQYLHKPEIGKQKFS